MVGHESYRYVEKSVFAQRTGFPLEMSNDLVFGAQLEDGSSQTDEHAIEGWFGQVGYDYANRYYISGSYRRDGSSRFYKDSRWVTSGRWVHPENFAGSLYEKCQMDGQLEVESVVRSARE